MSEWVFDEEYYWKERFFEQLRFNKNTHLGLGDIRLAIGMQKEICKLIDRFYEKKNIRNYKKPERENSFSKEDMIDFAEFVAKYSDKNRNNLDQMLHVKPKNEVSERTIDLLEIWKQERKIIYYK